MADEQNLPANEQEVSVATEEAAPTLTDEQVEFNTQMNMAFSDGEAPIENAVEDEPAKEEPTTEETPATETVAEETTEPVKDLGFTSVDGKEKTPEPLAAKDATEKTEHEFANEASKKIYDLIKNGNIKEVVNHFKAQELLSDLDNMGNEEKLKLYIKMQNPKFDEELIEDEYSENYSLDEDEYFDDAKKLRKEKLKLQQKIENDVEKASEYFSQYAKKVELPDISPKEVAVDKDYEDYKASIANSVNDYQTVIVPKVEALTEDKVKIDFEVKDLNNQMEFGVSISPSKEDFESAKKSALDFTGFVAETCYDKEGKFLPENLTQLVLLRNNFSKYAQSIARQAVNAERKRVVSAEKGVPSVQRDNNIPMEKTEFQKNMEFALS